MPHDPDPWLTQQEVAQRLHVAPSTVWLRVKNGDLPPGQRNGKYKVWRASVIEAYRNSLPYCAGGQTASV